MNRLEFSNNNPDLSPELLAVVKAVQEALNDKRARLQLEAVDTNPSALEAAYARERAKRPAVERPGISSVYSRLGIKTRPGRIAPHSSKEPVR